MSHSERRGLDVLVRASGGPTLLITNRTGHLMLVAACGFRADGTPESVSFTGSLFGEAELCALAQTQRRSTGYHRRHPSL